MFGVEFCTPRIILVFLVLYFCIDYVQLTNQNFLWNYPGDHLILGRVSTLQFISPSQYFFWHFVFVFWGKSPFRYGESLCIRFLHLVILKSWQSLVLEMILNCLIKHVGIFLHSISKGPLPS